MSSTFALYGALAMSCSRSFFFVVAKLLDQQLTAVVPCSCTVIVMS